MCMVVLCYWCNQAHELLDYQLHWLCRKNQSIEDDAGKEATTVHCDCTCDTYKHNNTARRRMKNIEKYLARITEEYDD